MTQLKAVRRDVLGDADRLIVQRRYQEVRELCQRTLSDPGLDALLEARLRVRLARALVMLCEPGSALELIELALPELKSSGGPYEIPDATDWKAGALYGLEDVRAVEVQEEAVRLMRRQDAFPLDIELRMLTHLGTIYTWRWRHEESMTILNEVLDRGQELIELDRLTAIHHNLLSCTRELGDLPEAGRHLHRILQLLPLRSDPPSPSLLKEERSRAASQQGRWEEAEQGLRASIEHADRQGLLVHRVVYRCTAAECYLERGMTEVARRMLEEASSLAASQDAPFSVSHCAMVKARMEASLGNHEASDAEFAKAVAALSLPGMENRRSGVLQQWADAAERRGELKKAIELMEAAVADRGSASRLRTVPD